MTLCKNYSYMYKPTRIMFCKPFEGNLNTFTVRKTSNYFCYNMIYSSYDFEEFRYINDEVLYIMFNNQFKTKSIKENHILKSWFK